MGDRVTWCASSLPPEALWAGRRIFQSFFTRTRFHHISSPVAPRMAGESPSNSQSTYTGAPPPKLPKWRGGIHARIVSPIERPATASTRNTATENGSSWTVVEYGYCWAFSFSVIEVRSPTWFEPPIGTGGFVPSDDGGPGSANFIHWPAFGPLSEGSSLSAAAHCPDIGKATAGHLDTQRVSDARVDL